MLRRHRAPGAVTRSAGQPRPVIRTGNGADGAGAAQAGLPEVVGPASLQLGASCLRTGDSWAATLVVTGYPAEAGMGWLEPLLQWQPASTTSGLASDSGGDPGGSVQPRLDVAVHIDPLPAASATGRLRKQRARLESARRMDAGRGRLDDPLIEAAAADAADLADLIARGESRLFSVGVYLTVHAPTRDSLHRAVAEVRAVAASVMLDTQPATWRQLSGWTSVLPLGADGLGMRRVMDTAALAASFPLASPDLPAPLPGDRDTSGVFFGITGATGSGVLWWDRWAQDNHNSVTLASSGAGKSYLTKLDVLRNLYTGVHVQVIDPEDEYVRLADPVEGVGGTVVRLGAPGVRINPLDLNPLGAGSDGATQPRPLPDDALTRRALFIHTLVAVLLGAPTGPAESAVLDRAIIAAYQVAGITHDPGTWARPAPLLRDVVLALGHPAATGSAVPADAAAIAGDGAVASGGGPGGVSGGSAGSPPGALLAARLAPWVVGSFSQLFDGPTAVTAQPDGAPLTVWSTRLLPDELRAAGMLLALDAIWRDIDQPPSPATSRTARIDGPARQSGNQLGNRSGNRAGQLPDEPGEFGGQVPNRSGRSASRLASSTGSGAAGRTGTRGAAGSAPESPRRLVVVDEAWSLMREREGARFLARMAKSARKRQAGLAVITQDAADLLSSDLGQVVLANSATQILMRQAPQAIAAVAEAFDLSDGEAQLLLAAEQGQALLMSGTARIPYTAVASWREHHLAAGPPGDGQRPGGPGSGSWSDS